MVLASGNVCRTGDGMGCKLGKVIDAVEEIVPSEFAEDWDNSGMQLGGRDWQVERIWVALDPLTRGHIGSLREGRRSCYHPPSH